MFIQYMSSGSFRQMISESVKSTLWGLSDCESLTGDGAHLKFDSNHVNGSIVYISNAKPFIILTKHT